MTTSTVATTITGTHSNDDNADDEAEFGAMLPEAKRMLREMAKLKSAGAANAADALAALERIERIDFPP